MSKMDNLRAMREARYQEAASRAPRARSVAAPAQPPPSRSAEVELAAAVPGDAVPALCGHRAISGRTCTREQGHASKSHRYS
jgi:hypothetical protein